jgi:hypothetical protein
MSGIFSQVAQAIIHGLPKELKRQARQSLNPPRKLLRRQYGAQRQQTVQHRLWRQSRPRRDGNREGNYGGRQVSHTNNSPQEWWEVDLGGRKQISMVKIFNRPTVAPSAFPIFMCWYLHVRSEAAICRLL